MTYKLPLNLIFSFEIFDMTDFAPFESESRLILDSLYRVDRIRVDLYYCFIHVKISIYDCNFPA